LTGFAAAFPGVQFSPCKSTERAMPNRAILELEIDPELHNNLATEAEAEHRTIAQVAVTLLRNHFKERYSEEYIEFMRECVAASEADIRAGRYRSNEEVSADFAARRAKLGEMER
jgi:predicted transcriptional regulator